MGVCWDLGYLVLAACLQEQGDFAEDRRALDRQVWVLGPEQVRFNNAQVADPQW